MKKTIFYLLIIIFAATAFCVITDNVMAQGIRDAGETLQETAEPAGFSEAQKDPRVLALEIIRIAFGILGVVFVGIIIYAGVLWMLSAGESEKVGKAKKWIINATIGLVIILASFAIASFILNSLVAAQQSGTSGIDGIKEIKNE